MDEIRGNGLLKRLAGDVFPQDLTIYDDDASAELDVEDVSAFSQS